MAAKISLDPPTCHDPERWSDLDWTPLQSHADIDAEDLDRIIIHKSPGAWFETYGRIIAKSKILVPPKANTLQKRAMDVVAWCLENNVPIRLFLLKPRQKGCSTVSMAIVYWMMNIFDNFRSVVIGKEYSQSDNLWQIFKTYSINDRYDWGFARRILEKVCGFGNGSQMDKETAEDSEAGRSGTFHGVVATEAARWREGGVANAEDVMNGLLNCVPYLPGTFVIQESTARGASGPFYEGWCDALDFEEYKRKFERGDNMDGAYIRVFAGWYEFEDSCDELTDSQAQSVADSITPPEMELIQKYGLEYGHIAWRRRTIRVECQRDEMKFDREYPETAEHAFRASAPSRFNTRGLQVMKAEAAQAEETWGILENMSRTPKINDKNFAFRRLDDYDPEARILVREKPKIGMRYIMAVDTMEGEAADDVGADLDHHVAMVIRRGYFDPDRGWQKPMVVARTPLSDERGKLFPCRWDIDILEDAVWRMAQYYGDCMIAVESNKDRGLIRGLFKRGAKQYERQTSEERGDVRATKLSGKLGFKTTGGEAENTRTWIIENLARAAREWDQIGEGIDVDRRTVKEMENFIVNEDGRAEAITGAHDDSVLALAIGLALIEHSTIMSPSTGRPPLPRDLQRISKRNRPRGQYS
jgi:hypothetical protein